MLIHEVCRETSLTKKAIEYYESHELIKPAVSSNGYREYNEEREISSSEIQEWIISDSDGEPTSHHEDIILELYKEVIVRDLNYLNPANLLGKLAIRILEKRNPGFLQQCIANLFASSGTNEDENINK